MKYQDFLRNRTNPESFLFTEKEIFILIKNGVGLRLSNNPNESTDGGWGDAVPLSYVGGAQDAPVDFAHERCEPPRSTTMARRGSLRRVSNRGFRLRRSRRRSTSFPPVKPSWRARRTIPTSSATGSTTWRGRTGRG